MGLLATVEFAQLRIDSPFFRGCRIGDAVRLSDGIYLDQDYFVIVEGGIFVAEFPALSSKNGAAIGAMHLSLLKSLWVSPFDK